MKKIIKNRIFIVIITLVIGVSGTLYAEAKYKANEILYSSSDGETMNVNDALNDLYNNSNKFDSFEFSMGEATNLGGADGYRSLIRFETEWFNDNIESLWVKDCASSSTQVRLMYSNSSSNAYNYPYIMTEALSNTTSEYKELDLKDIDSNEYKYTWIVAYNGSNEYMAAVQIKLIFK